MEKGSRASAFGLFLSAFSVLLGLLTVLISVMTFQAARSTDTDTLAVLGNVQNDDQAARVPPSDLTQPSAPSESEDALPESSSITPTYTVRLVPTDNINGQSAIGIYDSADALVLQASVPLATLMPSDKSALQQGITTESFESARQLVRDFCG